MLTKTENTPKKKKRNVTNVVTMFFCNPNVVANGKFSVVKNSHCGFI